MNHPNRKMYRPRQHLQAVGKQYPSAWKQIDIFRAARGRDLSDWPKWCYCPMAAAYAIVSGGGFNRCTPLNVGDVSIVAALAAWRVSQSIYRFDQSLFDRLVETEIGVLPVELLYHLPEWCVYIETPGRDWFGLPLVGFFAYLEHDIESGRPELRFLLDTDRFGVAELTGLAVHLSGGTIAAGVDAALDEASHQAAISGYDLPGPIEDVKQSMTAMLQGYVSLLLYLCSDLPDFADGDAPKYPQPKKTKKGWRIFPPPQPTIRFIGKKVGDVLRRASSVQSSVSGKRPHVRRAHWHLYWRGPGRTIPDLKWLHPVLVNMGDQTDD